MLTAALGSRLARAEAASDDPQHAIHGRMEIDRAAELAKVTAELA